ncbi:MAG: MFS transporter [Pseudonocardia sp.]|nr:MAG: MFS transporter [Pseudonocardia sp.]
MPETSVPPAFVNRSRSPALITAALAGCGLVTSSMQTLIIPLLPELPQLLSSSPVNASWVITVTLLAGAVSNPISGRLGDIFGKRRVALVLLSVVFAGSLLSALTTSLAPMLVGRTFQGIGLGIIPLGISMLRDTIPTDRVGRSVAVVSSTLGVGGAAGMPLSAFVSQHYNWHTLFWISAVLSVLGAIALWLVVPASPEHRGTRFDVPGAIGLAVGLTGLLLAVSKGTDWGWASVPTVGCAVGGLVVLVVWGFYQWWVSSPLVDLRISVRRPVLLTNLAAVAVGFGLFASSVVLPKLLQMPSTTGVGLGTSMMVASLCMAPSGLLMLAISPVAARLSAARGPRSSLIVGAMTIAVGYGFALALMTEVWHTVVVSCLIGVGVGFSYAGLPVLIMHAVPESETAAANGLNTLMRAIGTTAASTAAAVVLAQNFVTVDGHDYTTVIGFRLAFALAGIAALAALAIAWFIPRHEKTDPYASIPVDDPVPMRIRSHTGSGYDSETVVRP